jgi:2-keto-4-pentenoate hydratase/2-oxohepta-3-ene-1,7-dioic acid hydratase in catechol pathway
VRLAHLRTHDGIRLGLGVGSEVLRLDAVAPDAPRTSLEFLAAGAGQQARLANLARSAAVDAAIRERLVSEDALGSIDDLLLAPPIPRPSKVIGVALNYRSHAAEGGFTPPTRPVVFFKGPNSLIGHGEPILVPPVSDRIDHEGELAVVIGRRARHLDRGAWRDVVAGYTIVNDLTARDWQLEDIQNLHPWALTKSFDGYGPIGPWLVTPDEVPDPGELDLEVRVDGAVRQSGNTRQMIFDVGDLVIFLSQVLTLEPGDLIATGTPDGIGPVADGQTVEVRIANLGVLRNPVRFLAPPT